MSRRFQQYSSSDEPIPGYRLIRFLGKGNFGEVWMATAPGNKKVALKIIDLRGREGLLESKAIERIKDINHAHLVSIFAYWLVNRDGQIVDDTSISKLSVGPSGKDIGPPISGTMYFDPGGQELRPVALIVAMTLGSKNLSDLLEEYRKEGHDGIPVEVLLDLTEDAAKGLDYLNAPIHDHGEGPRPIIHGDIKPQNLLIVGDSLQICDFGLAREVDDLRKTATAMGTYAYAAPELLSGHPHVHSDQYCLAVSYLELRSGRLPLFGETNPLKIAELHRDGKLNLSGLGPHEEEVVRKATHPDPERRWISCRDMVRALRKAVDLDSGGNVPQGPALSAIHGDLKATMPVGALADTVRAKKAGTAGKKSLRFIVRAMMGLLATAMVAGGALWGLSRSGLIGPRKDSPEWFAEQFTILATSLPDKQDR
ncbi:MAG: serine/threonine-protein kinase, partial [Thermoguttaceae bacterium]